jgi:hypothetical protein
MFCDYREDKLCEMSDWNIDGGVNGIIPHTFVSWWLHCQKEFSNYKLDNSILVDYSKSVRYAQKRMFFERFQTLLLAYLEQLAQVWRSKTPVPVHVQQSITKTNIRMEFVKNHTIVLKCLSLVFDWTLTK